MARATHNIFAFRYVDGVSGVCVHDSDDDGETSAGSRLAEILRLMGADGVAVVVSRWFGGVLLGPDRFRLINNCARKVLEAKLPDCIAAASSSSTAKPSSSKPNSKQRKR